MARNKRQKKGNAQEREQRQAEKTSRANRKALVFILAILVFVMAAPVAKKGYDKHMVELARQEKIEEQCQIDDLVQIPKELKTYFEKHIDLKEIEYLRAMSKVESVVHIERELEPNFTVKQVNAFLDEGTGIIRKFHESDNPFDRIDKQDKAWAIVSFFFDGLNCRYIGANEVDKEDAQLLWRKYPRAALFHSIVNQRKGTCQSMPVYTVLMAEKLGLPIFVAHARGESVGHCFNIWDDGETRFNIEATTGNSQRVIALNENYLKDLEGFETAIKRGVFLTPKKTQDEWLSYLFQVRGQCHVLLDGRNYLNKEAIRDFTSALYLDPRNYMAAVSLLEMAIQMGRIYFAEDLEYHLRVRLGFEGKKEMEGFQERINNMKRIEAQKRELDGIFEYSPQIGSSKRK